MRMFVNRLGEMANFELGKERKKDFFVLSRVDLSCMQDACHMNFVIDLAHREVCVAQ